jgi:uncharacterized protein (TIRG00374 family)
MEPPKPKITWKTVVFPLIGLAAFFLYIYLFQVDIIGIIATARRADLVPYAFAIVLSLLEMVFFSISWRVLANFLKIKLSVARSFLFVSYGIFVDTIIPAESISGEALRVYLITKEQGEHTTGRAVASLVTHRILGMTMNVAILIVGMVMLSIETQVSPLIFNLILFLAAGITLTLLLIILFSFKEQWSLKAIDWLVRAGKFITRGKWHLQLTKIKEDACRIATSFHDSMKEFKRSPKPLASSIFYLSITWVFSLSIPYLVFVSLRVPVSWSVVFITSAIVLAVKSIPLGVPFEVGLPEITMTTLYTLLLTPTLGQLAAAGISATATILTRLITLWFRFFVGFLAQQWLELKPILAPKNNTSANTASVEKA